MAEKKKTEKKRASTGYKSPFGVGKEGVKSSPNRELSAKEIATAQKMVEVIGSGKRNGIIVVLQEFEEGGKKGIEGTSFCAGISPTERVQSLVTAMGMPVPIVMMVLSLMDGSKSMDMFKGAGHKHDKDGNCID